MSEHNHCHGNCCHEHNHSCACGHKHIEESKHDKFLLAVSAVLVVIGLLPINSAFQAIITLAAVVISAYPLLLGIIKKLPRFSLEETELMLIAIIAACCLKEFREAALVAILYRFGEMLEDKAVERSRRSVDSIVEIQQDFAHIINPDGSIQRVDAEDVIIGSLIRILPHERFPIDGTVTDGESIADASAITGESLPVELTVGNDVKSGMINGDGTLTVMTTENLENSTASRIIHMIEDAAERKGKTQKLISKFAKIYTPCVVSVAVLIAIIPSIVTGNPAEWIRRALVFLVASCPCALVISVPLGFFTGLGVAAKNGILVKGTAFVEAFAKVKAIVFDKTGTLTDGSFEVAEITPYGNFSSEQILLLAGAAEHFSSHPIARSIVEAAPKIDEALLSNFNEKAGHGVAVEFMGKRIACGGSRMLRTSGIKTVEIPNNCICVCVDNTLAGTIKIRSKIRNNAFEAVSELKQHGIKHTVMLTGDNELSAKEVADAVGIDEIHANLLPEDKLSELGKIKAKYGKVIYVGDGINDAPVLTAADVGVAMGLGTQAANESADIILVNDKLEGLPTAYRLFKRTNSTVIFNITFSLAVKAIVLLLGTLGIASMSLAVFADVGLCLICVIVAALIGFKKKTK